jgi:hypothetical protein
VVLVAPAYWGHRRPGVQLTRISHKTKIRRVANAKIHSYSRYLPGICAPATKKQCVFGVCSLVPDWLGNMLNELANYPTRHHSGLG